MAGIAGQEKFAPRTLASAVKITEGGEETVASQIVGLQSGAWTLSQSVGSVAADVQGIDQRVAALEAGGQEVVADFRWVDSAGVESSDTTIQRYLQLYDTKDGVWEWVNPPMVLGVEYRTVERYEGRTVYSRLLDLGNLPSNTTKTVTLPYLPVGYYAYWGWSPVNMFNTIPSDNPSFTVGFWIHGVTATIKTVSTNMTAYKAYINMRYLK